MNKIASLLLAACLLLPPCVWSATDYTADGNCVVAYTFEEASGSADDKCSGGTNDGTVGTGVTYSVSGQYGNAYDFDGTANGDVDVGDVAAVDTATALTIAAWFRIDTDSDGEISAKMDGGIADGWLFFRDDTASVSSRTDTVTFFIGDSTDTGNQRYEGATNAAPINTWVHACVIADLTGNTLDLFIDGTQSVGQVDITDTGGWDAGTAVLKVGTHSDDSTPFPGKIDEYIVLDTAKAEADCDSMMDNGIDGSQAAGDRRFLSFKVPERRRIRYLIKKGYEFEEAARIVKANPYLIGH